MAKSETMMALPEKAVSILGPLNSLVHVGRLGGAPSQQPCPAAGDSDRVRMCVLNHNLLVPRSPERKNVNVTFSAGGEILWGGGDGKN